MYIRVNLSARPPAVSLEEPEDCKRFHIAAEGGTDARAVGEALARTGTGRIRDRESAFVRVDVVRRLAEGRVGESWETDFSAMLDFARSKGWLSAEGDAIEAHIEWPGGS